MSNRGEVVEVVTADTAGHALIKFHDALDQFPRAWVSDENGDDVSLSELMARAAEEIQSSQR